MNTPAHLIFGAAAFSEADRKGSLAAALLGAIAPDLSLYLMVCVSLFVLGVPADTVFREYYYSDAWQMVFAVDNSFVLWGVLLGVALWRRWPLVTIFAGAAILHLALDFPLHTHDARQHFWPLTDWVFNSPVSYWDHRAHAGIVGPLEAGGSVVLAGVVMRRYSSWPVRLMILGFLLAELASSGVWRFVF